MARIFKSIGIGIVTGLIAALVIVILSAVLPGITINAAFWGTIIGVVAGFIYFFSGETIV